MGPLTGYWTVWQPYRPCCPVVLECTCSTSLSGLTSGCLQYCPPRGRLYETCPLVSILSLWTLFVVYSSWALLFPKSAITSRSRLTPEFFPPLSASPLQPSSGRVSDFKTGPDNPGCLLPPGYPKGLGSLCTPTFSCHTREPPTETQRASVGSL